MAAEHSRQPRRNTRASSAVQILLLGAIKEDFATGTDRQGIDFAEYLSASVVYQYAIHGGQIVYIEQRD